MGRVPVLLTPRNPPSTHAEWIVDELEQRLGEAVEDCRDPGEVEGLIAVEGTYRRVEKDLYAIEPDWPVWLDHVLVTPKRVRQLLHR